MQSHWLRLPNPHCNAPTCGQPATGNRQVIYVRVDKLANYPPTSRQQDDATPARRSKRARGELKHNPNWTAPGLFIYLSILGWPTSRLPSRFEPTAGLSQRYAKHLLLLLADAATADAAETQSRAQGSLAELILARDRRPISVAAAAAAAKRVGELASDKWHQQPSVVSAA